MLNISCQLPRAIAFIRESQNAGENVVQNTKPSLHWWKSPKWSRTKHAKHSSTVHDLRCCSSRSSFCNLASAMNANAMRFFPLGELSPKHQFPPLHSTSKAGQARLRTRRRTFRSKSTREENAHLLWTAETILILRLGEDEGHEKAHASAFGGLPISVRISWAARCRRSKSGKL